MNKVQREITDLPVALIEPIGNLIRKIAYTQLSSVRLVGICISIDDSSMPSAMLTSPIEGTTTPLDIIPYLNNELKGDIVNSMNDLKPMETRVITENFTDLKSTLGKFMEVDSIPDTLLITSSIHTVSLMFCKVDKDMDSRSLQAFMPTGFIPVPTTVLRNFKLDYSNKDNGVLRFEVTEEFSEQLDNKIIEVMGLISQKSKKGV